MMSYSVVYPLTRFEYIIFNNIDIVRYFFFFFFWISINLDYQK